MTRPWICLLMNMFDRVLEMPQVLNVPGFWKRPGCICKCYTEFLICLNMAQYVSIMPDMLQHALMFPWMLLSMPDHGWILLNFKFFKKFFVAQETIDLNISWPSNFFGKYFMAPPINFSFLFKGYLWQCFRVVLSNIQILNHQRSWHS